MTEAVHVPGKETEKKVLVAMSGGVDSSVVAYLLKEQGYEVAGLTAEMWDDAYLSSSPKAQDHEKMSDNAQDARHVAAHLGIEHFVLRLDERFLEEVVDPFIQAYQSGRTPNPCVICNRRIKFGAFLEAAERLGYPLIATGHYARIDFDKATQEYVLKKASGPKDQSYVLHVLGQKQLSRVLFPLAEYDKPALRRLAQKAGLPVANKPDSQDICFINDIKYSEFIAQYTKKVSKPGEFVTKDGKVLGQHKGLEHYTIGQRKGLGIAADSPYFVVSLNCEKNQVVLGSNEDLMRTEMLVIHPHFISDILPSFPFRAQIKIRYASLAMPGMVEKKDDNTLKIIFDEPVRAITPGQAAVFYDGDIVLGGGEIDK